MTTISKETRRPRDHRGRSYLSGTCSASEAAPAIPLLADAEDVEMIIERPYISRTDLQPRSGDTHLPDGRALRIGKCDLIALVIDDEMKVDEACPTVLRQREHTSPRLPLPRQPA